MLTLVKRILVVLRITRKSLIAFNFLFLFASPSFACGWLESAEMGVHGGFMFFRGLIIQTDEQTGRKLSANQSVTVGSLAECVQVCLSEKTCTGVSHRPTSSGQCLTFAGFDFETGHNMALYLHRQPGIKYKSAHIRTGYQGSVCR